VLIEPAPVDLLVVLLGCAALVLGRMSFRRVHEIPLICLLVFIVANLFSALNATDGQRALFYVSVTIYLAISMMLFIGVINRYREHAVEAIMHGYAFAALFSTLLAVPSFFELIPFQETLLLSGRAKGLFKDPNVMGPFLVPVCLYALAKIESQLATLAKWRWIAVFTVATTGVLFSFSRACWLNFLCAVLAYAGLGFLSEPSLQERMKWIKRTVLVACLGVAVVGVAMMTETVSGMMRMRMGDSRGLQDYDRIRFETQRIALETARQNVAGLGPGQSEDAFHYATHSSYIRVLVENGVLGFVSFCALALLSLFNALRGVWQQESPYWRSYSRVTAACLLGLLLNSFVIDTFHWRHTWLLLSFAWTSYQPLAAAARQQVSLEQLSPSRSY
jgi:hypothetical protein